MSALNRVLVIGVFDLFHRGHLELLKTASDIGELFVLVNGDSFTEQYKRRPIINENDRLAIVSSIGFVSYAEITNIPDSKPFINKHGITSIIHGDDWDHESYLRQICLDDEYISMKGIKMIYTKYYSGVSTSGIIKMIRGTCEA